MNAKQIEAMRKKWNATCVHENAPTSYWRAQKDVLALLAALDAANAQVAALEKECNEIETLRVQAVEKWDKQASRVPSVTLKVTPDQVTPDQVMQAKAAQQLYYASRLDGVAEGAE